MSHATKTPVNIDTNRDYSRDLKALYARRAVLDELIASLEAYDRYRASKATATSVIRERRTA